MKDFTQDLVICENAQEHNAKIVRAVTHEQFSHMEAPPTPEHVYWIIDASGRSFYSEDLYTACDLFLKHNE